MHCMKSIEKVVYLQIKLSIKIIDSENLELQWETFYTGHPTNEVKIREIILSSPETTKYSQNWLLEYFRGPFLGENYLIISRRSENLDSAK